MVLRTSKRESAVRADGGTRKMRPRRLRWTLAAGLIFAGSGLISRPAAADHYLPPSITTTVADEVCTPSPGQPPFLQFGGLAGMPEGETQVQVHLFVDGVDSAQVLTEGDNWTAYVSLPVGTNVLHARSGHATDAGHALSGDSNQLEVEVVDAAAGIIGAYADENVISPRTPDGYRDTTIFSVDVMAPGEVHFVIRRESAEGPIVRITPSISRAAGQTHAYRWNGTNMDNAPAGSGTYFVAASWTDGTCSWEDVDEGFLIQVDATAPSMISPPPSPSSVFPKRDAIQAYRDTLTIAWSDLSERAAVMLFVYRGSSSSIVRTISYGTRNTAWQGTLRYNARDNSGRLLPEGTYTFRFRLTDTARYVRWTPRRSFTVSHRYLVAKTVTLTKSGDSYYAGSTDGCGSISEARSGYRNGVYLSAPDCFYNEDAIDGAAIGYAFALPSSPAYGRVLVKAGGYSPVNGSTLKGFVLDGVGDFIYLGQVSGDSGAWRPFPSVSGANAVVRGRVRVWLSVLSGCDCDNEDWDIGAVQLVATYGAFTR